MEANTESSDPKIAVVQSDHLPAVLPHYVEIVERDQSAVCTMGGRVAVAYKTYKGSQRTGNTPWAVLVHSMTNQVVHSYHESFEKALTAARRLNSEETRKESPNPLESLLKRIFK